MRSILTWNMEVSEIRSSSNELSSAPNSDTEGPYPTLAQSNASSGGIAVHSNANTTSTAFGAAASNTPSAGRQDPAPPKRKRRTKQEMEEAAALKAEKKQKVARKPRATPATTTATRKKLKTEGGVVTPVVQSIPQTPDSSAPRINQPLPVTSTTPVNNEAAKYSQNGFSNTTPSMNSQNPTLYNVTPQLQPQPQPPPPKARAMFDPVRGHATERTHDAFQQSTPIATPLQHSTPPRVAHYLTASPSLSSIMNPIETNTNDSRPSTAVRSEIDAPTAPFTATISKPEINTAMEVDQPVIQQEKKPVAEVISAAKPVSKPRAKEQPPPLPTGSGLLSSTLFGGDSQMDSKQDGNEKGPNIVLHIDLKDPNNKVINFARLAEEKYGFAALYPRQAAQKERLAKLAAAGAALERSVLGNKGGTSAGDSGDEDASVDIDRDSDNDGDITMSGVNGTGEAVNSGTDGAGTGPKRRKRKDEYDADDPFVDDSEMLWEAQAAASKDGFFVYCGPLVPEGEKPAVERYVNDTNYISTKLIITAELMVLSNEVAVAVEVVALDHGVAVELPLRQETRMVVVAKPVVLDQGGEVLLANLGSPKPNDYYESRRRRAENRRRLLPPNPAQFKHRLPKASSTCNFIFRNM